MRNVAVVILQSPRKVAGVFKEMLFSIRIFVNTTQMRRSYIKNSRGNLALPTHLQLQV